MTTAGAEGAADQGGFDGDEKPPHPLRNWHQPLLTAVGMAIAVAVVAAFDPTPGPLVLAAVLAMTISRNRLITSWRGRAEAVIVLPFVGLATAGVGYLLFRLPILGAIAYVAALFLSIWLRKFGPAWSRIGSLIALPFITLLISPGAGIGTTPLGVALLSIFVLVLVVALRLLAEVTRFVPKPARPPEHSKQGNQAPQENTPADPTPAATPRKGTRPIASTRMAIQMAIALAAAFIIGALVFPQHVTWVVLTAFIVCSGNRGRADVLYKSGLRIVGATLGTLVASLGLRLVPFGHSALQGPPLVVVLLVIIAVGLWLREWTYAAWAVVMTLVITLLQGAAVQAGAGAGAVAGAAAAAGTGAGAGVAEGAELWIRILAIIVGAACGLLASWFVLPVRSESVVRRRIADALAALSGFAAAPDIVTEHDLDFTLERLGEVGAPWAALERITRWRTTQRKPGQWIDLVEECARLVRARVRQSGATLSPPQRMALGEARRAMRDPLAIGPRLLALRDALTADPGAGSATDTGTDVGPTAGPAVGPAVDPGVDPDVGPHPAAP